MADEGQPRHRRWRVLTGVEHASLRAPHQTPARLCGELPDRRLAPRTRQSRHGRKRQLLHERAGGSRRNARDRRRVVSARGSDSPCAPVDTLVLISNRPQINNPATASTHRRAHHRDARRTSDDDLGGARRCADHRPGRPRIGYWKVGVPPSGDGRPVVRLANLAVGNAESATGLEATLTGPTLRFEEASVVAVTGAGARHGEWSRRPTVGADHRRRW